MQEYYCKVNEAPGNQEGGPMREKLLTNDQMAKAYGGYDFKTADMKAVCRAQRELDLALFKKEVEKVEKHQSPYPHVHIDESFACSACVWEKAVAGILSVLREKVKTP